MTGRGVRPSSVKRGVIQQSGPCCTAGPTKETTRSDDQDIKEGDDEAQSGVFLCTFEDTAARRLFSLV